MELTEDQKTMSEKSLEIYRKDMSTLQAGFAMYCKLLGLRKSTCLSLTLMLNSKQLLVAIMKFMAEIEANGTHKDMPQDDITTMIVDVATQLKDCWDKMEKNSSKLFREKSMD